MTEGTKRIDRAQLVNDSICGRTNHQLDMLALKHIMGEELVMLRGNPDEKSCPRCGASDKETKPQVCSNCLRRYPTKCNGKTCRYTGCDISGDGRAFEALIKRVAKDGCTIEFCYGDAPTSTVNVRHFKGWHVTVIPPIVGPVVTIKPRYSREGTGFDTTRQRATILAALDAQAIEYFDRDTYEALES